MSCGTYACPYEGLAERCEKTAGILVNLETSSNSLIRPAGGLFATWYVASGTATQAAF